MSNLFRTATFAAVGVALFAAPSAVAAPWSAPATLASGAPTASSASNPRIESDSSAGLTAVWIAGGDSTRAVYASTKPRAGSWSAPVQISGASTNGITDLTLSVNEEGAALAAWAERRGYRERVLVTASRAAGAAAWRTPQEPQPALPDASVLPWTGGFATSVLPGGSGSLSIWQRDLVEPNRGDVRERQSGAAYLPATGGGDWLPENAPTVRDPELAIDSDGDATLLDVNADGRVVTSTRPNGGAWNEPTLLGDDGDRTTAPVLAVDALGRASAAWLRSTNDNAHELRLARRAADGTWSAPSTLATAPRTDSDGLNDPRIAVDTSGRTTVTWSQLVTSGGNYTTTIHTASAPAGGAFAAPTTLTTWVRPTGSGTVIPGLQSPDLSVAGSGLAVLSWVKGKEIQAVTRTRDTWSPAQTVVTNAAELNTAFDGEVANDGRATVVVAGSDGVAASTTDLSDQPAQTLRGVIVNATLLSFTGRCPLTANAYLNGRTYKLPINDRGSSRSRCAYGALVPQPSTAKVGTTVFVAVSGSGLLPVFLASKVIAHG